jgi:hypothetical protein
MDEGEMAQAVVGRMPESGLFAGKRWRTGSRPFGVSAEFALGLEELGRALVAFYRACETIYLDSAEGRGAGAGWVAELLDKGKPGWLVELGRSERWRGRLPAVIRPDLILEEGGGYGIAELDSVPGGIGLTGWLGETYGGLGHEILGGAGGMVKGFGGAVKAEAILVSDESADYRPEMSWLAGRLGELDGRSCVVEDPARFPGSSWPGSVYRFFELFDLGALPEAERVLRGGREVELSPPPRAFLEEKLWLALFWVPALRGEWERLLGGHDALLRAHVPEGWVVSPMALPAHAELPGLGIWEWGEVARLGRKDRELVLKVSGFSERAWGSRGVWVGHDLSREAWASALDEALALAGEGRGACLLQRFRKGRVERVRYLDEGRGEIVEMGGRVRLTPYFFVGEGEEVVLGGGLATIVPADKKVVHGMEEAVMVPVGVLKDGGRRAEDE